MGSIFASLTLLDHGEDDDCLILHFETIIIKLKSAEEECSTSCNSYYGFTFILFSSSPSPRTFLFAIPCS